MQLGLRITSLRDIAKLDPAIAAGQLALCQCWQREDCATSVTESGAGYSGNPRNPTSNSDAN